MSQKVKFGFSQLNRKTPDVGHWIPQLYVLLSVSGMGMMTALGVSAPIEHKIAEICLAFSPLFVLIGQMFGISLTQTEEQPDPPPPPAAPPPATKAATDQGGSTSVGGSNPPPSGLPDHP